MNAEQDFSSSDIAVIGMSGRFPGATGLEQFWINLCEGREGIRVLSDNELLQHGIAPDVIGTRDYVKAVADLQGVEYFDNGFFGFTPRDAELMDPQLRLLLECAWATIEHAGYNVEDYRGAIGVYAGAAPNSYFIENLVPNRELMRTLAGPLSSLEIYTASDALSTMVSFKLNLRGPSITVQTACSTSLVAVHLACQSLLSHESDMALAGGVNLNIPQERGYVYQKGMILSPDGHCRPFDADAAGTVFGGGVGLVLLKRLTDALADRDCIHAVIKGSAVNNDGSTKAGFTAPSVVGQARAIADALAIADVPADAVSYVEAHGTGTALGDPIEVEALTRAFRQSTERSKYCGIGSVKSNIGHLDRAAGVASLIKTILSLKHGQIPPTLHFKRPNPDIDFNATPFYVVDKLTEWKSVDGPRRAVVNSVGFGGTNACVVLEEAQPVRASGASRPYQVLTLSARTESALDEATQNLAEHFEQHPQLCISDAAYTLHIGRQPFDFRRVMVCRDIADALKKLTSPDEKGIFTGRRQAAAPSVVFMFPGQGAQYAGMSAELYQTEPIFRAEVDRCADVLVPILGGDLRTILFPAPGLEEEAGRQLVQTRFTQPALFIIEYALAKLWMSWGIQPAAMIGHSVGEYVAACLAGVFTLEDALAIVAERAALVQAQPSGAMLSVRLPEKDIAPLLDSRLAIAAVNSPHLCVVSGPHDAIGGLEKQLQSRGIIARHLHTSHAFHSPMMEPVLAPFTEVLRRVTFCEPRIPYVSNVTAKWITADLATSPEYWAGHVRQTVRFADGLTTLLGDGSRLFLEVGPGQTLSQMVHQHSAKRAGTVVLASLSASRDTSGDIQAILESLGKAWIAGVKIDWRAFHSNEERYRVPLPTYPFEKKEFWVRPPTIVPEAATSAEKPEPVNGSIDEARSNNGIAWTDARRQEKTESESAQPSRPVQIKERLQKMLQELSGMRSSDLNESATFLEMGFDSLFLAEFGRKLEREFGVSVNFSQLADATPADLARLLDQTLPPDKVFSLSAQRQSAATVPVASVVIEELQEQVRLLTQQVQELSKGRSGVQSEEFKIAGLPAAIQAEEAQVVTLPITAGQREIWFASKMGDNASRAYNEVVVIRLQGVLHVGILEQSIQDLVDRQDSLRITISADGKQQFIHPKRRQEVPLTDLSAMTAPQREARLREIIGHHSRVLFDLVNGPLMKVHLVRLQADEHTLLFAFHHVVIDGWSTHVIVSEVSRLYSAKIRGEAGDVSPAMQYRDYVGWYYEAATVRKRKEDEQYWVKSFSDLPASVELPAKGPRPLRRSYRAGNASITIEPELYRRLKKASARSSCTFFHFLLATFKVWLHRITGQKEIVVGVPIAGQLAANLQRIPGCDRLVGHCSTVVPIRSEVTDAAEFADFLSEVKRKVLEARAHESFTYSELVEKLNPPRDPGRLPFISVTLNLNDEPTIHWDTLKVDLEVPPFSCVFFDLVINMWESADGLRIACYYADDLFDSETVKSWLLQWKSLTVSAAENPVTRLSRLELMGKSERDRLLIEWNSTEAEFPRDRCVHELVEGQAGRTPAAVAVVYEGERVSYRTLNERANQLAHYLRRLGVGPGARVGICLDRSPSLVVALLGILKTGAAYVPLDPIYPAERLAYMLADAEAAVLLTHERLLKALGPITARVVCLDREGGDLGREATTNPSGPVGAGELAYVIYTSGSTGKPKGVQIEHRALVNFLHAMRQVPGLAAGDRLLAVTTLAFDIAGLELFLPLVGGACVILVSGQTTVDGRALMRALEQHEVTLMQATPATWRLLVEAGWPGRAGLKILCGGEPLPQDLAQQLLPRCAELWNMYGPTETTIWSTCGRVRGAKDIHIGRPIQNTEIYILDEQLQPVPVGVAGELWIGGEGLARGYLNRPELTAEKFVAHPFKPGARLYRTGDLARYRPDGNLECLGRRDFQVKLRGFRIELGEIEAVLNRHPAVKQCVVVAREDTPGDKRLVAYFETQDGANVSVADLRLCLKKELPDYMLPAAFMPLERLPLTPNGKIDRKALPFPEGRRMEAQVDFLAPRDSLEQALANIWSKILRVKQVGLHDDFFESGGNSLSAVLMLLEAQKLTGKMLPLATLLREPTIEALAAILREHSWTPSPGGHRQPNYNFLYSIFMRTRRACGRWRGKVRECALPIVREARFEEKDLAGIWKVLRQAFPVPYGACSLADFIREQTHKWLDNPARTPDHVFGWVLESPTDGIIGFVGQVPVRIKIAEQEIVGASPCAFGVLPAYRAHSLLLGEHLMDWGDRHFLVSTTANEISSMLNQAAGLKPIPVKDFSQQLLWLFQPETAVTWTLGQSGWKVLQGLTERFPGVYLLKAISRVWFARHRQLRFTCPKLSVEPVFEFTEEFTDLWENNKKDYDVTMVRDRAFLTWRHIQVPSLVGRTFVFACRDHGQLRGYVALQARAPESGYLRGHYVVTDLFYERARKDVLYNLMNHAFEFAKAQGCSIFQVSGYSHEVMEELKTQRPYIRKDKLCPYWYKSLPAVTAGLEEEKHWWPSGADGDSNL